MSYSDSVQESEQMWANFAEEERRRELERKSIEEMKNKTTNNWNDSLDEFYDNLSGDWENEGGASKTKDTYGSDKNGPGSETENMLYTFDELPAKYLSQKDIENYMGKPVKVKKIRYRWTDPDEARVVTEDGTEFMVPKLVLKPYVDSKMDKQVDNHIKCDHKRAYMNCASGKTFKVCPACKMEVE